MLALDEALSGRADHWFVREVLLQQARTLKMIDVTARTFFAIIRPGSCFAGSFFEIALACDRSFILDEPGSDNAEWLLTAELRGAVNQGSSELVLSLAPREGTAPTQRLASVWITQPVPPPAITNFIQTAR